MIKRTLLLLTLLLSTVLCHTVYSEEYVDHTNFEKYSVHYTLLSSTFVKPDIAAIHGIKRSKYENLLNVSVVPKGEYGGLPVKIHGTATNLLQQQKQLKFIEIKEETATYYLAPVRINNKEVIHFNLTVTPEIEKYNEKFEPLELKFTKTVYAD